MEIYSKRAWLVISSLWEEKYGHEFVDHFIYEFVDKFIYEFVYMSLWTVSII